MNRRHLWRLLKFVVIATIGLGVVGLVVMSLWNWLAPAAFGGHVIGFWQAIGLFVLARLLVGGLRRGGHGRSHWRRRMAERWEGTTFPAAADAAELRARLAARFGPHAGAAEAFYPVISDAGARAASLDLFGDELFAWGAWRAASDHSRIAPTWLYHFAHAQPFAAEQRYREAERATDLGVFHSSEYPYVFGTTGALTRPWGEADRRMTELMQAAWLAFAKTGRPDAEGLPAWPTFDDRAPTVMHLAPAPALGDVPRRTQLEFIDRATP